MKKISGKVCFWFILVSVSCFAINAFAAKPCSDVRISWTFLGTVGDYSSAITDDGKGEYRGGADGVFNSVIHNCFGSWDATLGLNKSKRTLFMTFSPIPGTDNVEGSFPTFAGQTIPTKPFINIANITGNGYPVGTTYYTKMGMWYIKAPGDNRTSYGLDFLPYDSDPRCPFTDGICVFRPAEVSPYQNTPVAAAWVRVSYVAPNQWIVEGAYSDPEIQRATLFGDGIHRGQFSMPFRILITALDPLP
jgi:hypothetical protein